ncbi:MAG: hypothetical protein HN919_09590 [Verrucomicrobia bacterium]|jgi:hypothetical protein|nr:hypothetical protein [Verrucomicrobiota bacterium]MBT7066542.1 hypothetical protein [Verrucomicrobiota bacterium]MBT7700862.1 hypothetical protein [Verrucomicrobiota bacterium]
MTKRQPYARVKAAKRGLSTIAVWQFAAFILLLLLIWANEVFDFSHLVYSRERTPPDYFRAAILSACVAATAVVTVGYTFVLQTKILAGFIVICSYCHKVKIEREHWKNIEGYISQRSRVTFSHGICPACFDDQIRAMDEDDIRRAQIGERCENPTKK